jgi:hypothetical protein
MSHQKAVRAPKATARALRSVHMVGRVGTAVGEVKLENTKVSWAFVGTLAGATMGQLP